MITMPYYHVRLFYYVEHEPPKIKHIDQINLQESYVAKEITEPYLSGKSFRFRNRLFEPSEVANFLIKMTPQRVHELVIDLYSNFVHGTDVSDMFLKRSRKKESKTRKDVKNEKLEEELSIPKEVFEKLPQEIQKTIEGVKLCYKYDYADFCFMGIRKALGTAIHIRFRKEGKEEELYDSKGEPYKLTKWIELAKQNRFLSASLARKLTKEVKVFGDVSSHDYRVDFHREDVPSIFKLLRLALDRMYHEEEKVQREIRRKPQKRSTLSAKYAFVGEAFDLPRFQTNLRAFDEVSDSEIRYKILGRIRDQTIDLPYDGMPQDIKKTIIRLLQSLRKEVRNEKMRRLCLDIFHVVNARRDNEVNSKIKELFLSWIEENYQDFTIEEKRYAMDIRQRLDNYNPEFMKELMLNSVNKWSPEEFDTLYKEIEFDRLDQEYIREFKILLWKLIDEAKREQSGEKAQRIEKLLSLSYFR